MTIPSAIRARPDYRRFGKFLAVGVINTGFGYLVYLAGLAVKLAPEIALAVATFCGAFFNYVTTGQFVFGHKSAARLLRFLAAYVVTYVVNLLILRTALSWGAPAWAAQAISLPIVVVISYLIMSLWVFRESKP